MAKKRLGLEDPQNPQQQPSDKKKMTLQEAIEAQDEELAVGLVRSAAQLRQAELDARTREINERNRLQVGVAPIQAKDPGMEARKQINDQAVYLLSQGVDPKIVGQILLSSTANVGPNPLIVSPSGGGQQGMTMADVLAILDRLEARKGDGNGEITRITAALDKLTERVERITEDDRAGRYRSVEPIDPATNVKQQVELFKSMGEAMEQFGYVKVSNQSAGENIESLKEKNRHDEELERLKTEREYKEKIGNTLAELPERIGKGISSQLMGVEEEANTGGLPTYPCTCGHKIVIPPGAPETLTCGKCGAVYSKGGKDIAAPAQDPETKKEVPDATRK